MGARPRWNEPAVLAALVALAAGLAVMSREIGGMGGDDAEYVLLAKSLASFEGYRSPWAPGPTPPHVLYPPVLPLLLVPFAWAAPGSFLLCHVPSVLAAGAAVLLLARLFERRGVPPWAAAGAALVPALSRLWLANAADVLSDLPCLAFAAAALHLLEPGDLPRLPRRRILGAAAAAALAFYTRTAAVALVLPVALALCVGRRTRGRDGWLAAGGLLGACGLWFAYGAAFGEGGGYADQLGVDDPGLLPRAWAGLGMYFRGVPSFVFPRPGTAWDVAGWTLWAFAATAVVDGFRRRRTGAVLEAFLLAYLAMQSAWPFQDPRFAIPMAALFVPLAVEEVHRAAGFLRMPAAKIAIGAGALLLLPNLEILATRVLPRAWRERPAAAPGTHEPAAFADSWNWTDDQYAQAGVALASYLHACDLVREERIEGLPEGAVLVSNPRTAALLTGRRAVQALERRGPPGRGAVGELPPGLYRESPVILVDSFRGPRSETLRGLRAFTGFTSLLRLPGGVEILEVAR